MTEMVKNTNDSIIQNKFFKAPKMSFMRFSFLKEISIKVPITTVIIMNQGT